MENRTLVEGCFADDMPETKGKDRKNKKKKDIYEIITDKILEQLETGVVPWQKPWSGGQGCMPKNLISDKAYRGINVFLLGFQGYDSPYWLSFNQCKQVDGNIIKGQKASMVIFWKWINNKEESEPDTNNPEEKGFPMLRYYNVFNTEQCTDINHKRVKELRDAEKEFDFDPIPVCEAIVEGMPKRPEIQHIENRAFYRPSTDKVNMPKQERFKCPEQYYSVLFHELTHSTGHENRLNRRPSDVPRIRGDKEYSQEELVAEMGAAYLCGITGIENKTLDTSAAYIENWLSILKNSKNKRMVVMAGAQAQKAADFIQNITFAENNC